MDVRTIKANAFKKVLGVGLLAAAAITNSTAHAAQASVTIDVSLPTVLVMYHYDTIALDIDKNALGTYLVGVNGSACGVDEFCSTDGAAAPVTASSVSGAREDIAVAAPTGTGFLENTTATFRLVDAVGVRAFGCSQYTATQGEVSSDAGISIPAGNINRIHTAPCSFAMTLGDLDFDMDFSLIADGTTGVSAVADVQITGI